MLHQILCKPPYAFVFVGGATVREEQQVCFRICFCKTLEEPFVGVVLLAVVTLDHYCHSEVAPGGNGDWQEDAWGGRGTECQGSGRGVGGGGNRVPRFREGWGGGEVGGGRGGEDTECQGSGRGRSGDMKGDGGWDRVQETYAGKEGGMERA